MGGLGVLSMLFLSAGIIFQFFVALSGGIGGSFESQIWFLEASTTGVSPATRDPSRWTFWAVCGRDASNGHNTNCGAPIPALPFDPPRNFRTDTGVPSQFLHTSHYYYLSRFMFAFWIVSMFCAVMALFTTLIAMCSKGGWFSGFNPVLSLVTQVVAAALMTTWTVQGRDAFRKNGQSAHLGVRAYAYTWAAVASLLLSTLCFYLKSSTKSKAKKAKARSRRPSRRDRASFAVDSESQHRIKDNYS